LEELIEPNNNIPEIIPETTPIDPDSSSTEDDSDSDATITNEAFLPIHGQEEDDYEEEYDDVDDDDIDDEEGSSEGEYIYDDDDEDDDGEDVGGGPCSAWTISTIQEEDEDEVESEEEEDAEEESGSSTICSNADAGIEEVRELELNSGIDPPCSNLEEGHEQTESRVSTRHQHYEERPESPVVVGLSPEIDPGSRPGGESGTRVCLSSSQNLDTAQHEPTTTCHRLGSPQQAALTPPPSSPAATSPLPVLLLAETDKDSEPGKIH